MRPLLPASTLELHKCYMENPLGIRSVYRYLVVQCDAEITRNENNPVKTRHELGVEACLTLTKDQAVNSKRVCRQDEKIWHPVSKR